MLQDRIRNLRIQNGISQEELALRLGVVRQTVSKWERGISVPDADTLIKLAEILEVTVSDLLGEKFQTKDETMTKKDETIDKSELSRQLAKINEHLAERNQRSRRIVKVLGIICLIIILLIIVTILLTIRI